MLLKTRVKINTITNLHDARFCAGMGVEFLGFPLDNSGEKEKIAPNVFSEIRNWLSGVKYIGEINEDDLTYLKEYQVDILQTNNEPLLEKLKEYKLPIIFRKNGISHSTIQKVEKELETLHQKVDYLLLEVEFFDEKMLETLKKWTKKYQIILGGNITEENVHQLIDTINPIGIALNAGKEIKTGFNDLDQLADTLESIEID